MFISNVDGLMRCDLVYSGEMSVGDRWDGQTGYPGSPAEPEAERERPTRIHRQNGK